MIEAVVKVGGSLGRGTCLPELGARLAALGRRHGLLVVPGGGAFADVVREYDRRFGLRPATSHWMAILAMEQYAYVLAELIPGSHLSGSLDEARERLAGRGVAVLLPWAALRHDDGLPQSWSVTSDSIAGWVTSRVGADLLVLLKDRRGMEGLASAGSADRGNVVSTADLAAAPGVDGHFGAVLEDSAWRLWMLDGEHPERLAELLESGTTEGLRLARSGL